MRSLSVNQLFLKHFIVLLCFTVLIATLPQSAFAQRGRISLVRDAEIEALVKSYAAPLLRAAGLHRTAVNINIVNDNSFNAFVSGRGMFINTGLLLQAEDPNEVIGVIAHEIGHVVGGHQTRLRERVENAMRIARWTSLLGVGIGVAGAASGSGDVARSGLSIAAGSRGFALRNVLQYQRSEEVSADRTAVSLLRKTKQSGKGMLETFRRLERANSISSGRIDPYLRSHPTPRERIESLRSVIKDNRYYSKKSPANLKLRHDLVRAKIAAYVGGDRYSRALLASKKLHPLARLYGRAITSHLYGSPKKALPLIDTLIKRMPRNAYVHEMKGEILLRSGQAKKAVKPFRRAVQLDKTKAGFIRVELGHALLDVGTKKSAKEAVIQLKKGLARDRTAIAGYQYLAIAYGQLGDTASALLASAEFALRTGKKSQAKQYAQRAQKGFKRGKPGWLRAQDIIGYK